MKDGTVTAIRASLATSLCWLMAPLTSALENELVYEMMIGEHGKPECRFFAMTAVSDATTPARSVVVACKGILCYWSRPQLQAPS